MARFFPYRDVLIKLKNKILQGIPIVIAGVSTALTARAAELAGADLLLFYNSGRYAAMGIGSLAGLLPLNNANVVTLEMAREITLAVRETPLIAGVFAEDPFHDIREFLRILKSLGISGVINFPTISMYDGKFRSLLEKQGFSYEKELELMKIAHEENMLAVAYAFNEEEAQKLAKVGTDIIIAHMGYREKELTIEEAITELKKIHKVIKEINPETLLLCHGAPIIDPKTFEVVYRNVEGVVGFMGFEGIERRPVERIIVEQIRMFTSIRK